ncbi:MAG TPA: TonB-dependent receptor, partial [Pyrinomonadaceae bacterium]|nr:TonB-dependent receptor [Pyrinomonadaceae bacterium]
TNFTGIGGINTTQLATANGLLAMMGGLYNGVNQSFNQASISDGFVRGATALTPFRYENHSLYVADRWSAAKGLTLNLGVRYELFPAMRLNNGLALEPLFTDLDNVVPDLLNPNGSYVPLGTNAGRKNAYYKTDYNNFAPNLGIAWSPSFEGGVMGWLFGQNKTVLRGGYSHIYGNDSIVTSINNAAVGNQGLGRTAVSLAATNSRLINGNPPTVPQPANPTFPRSYLVNNGPGIGEFWGTVFAIDPKLQTPMVQQYSFGIQRELFGGMAFEIRYVGSRSSNLGRGIDLGQVDMTNNGFLADFLRAQANMRVSNPTNPAAGNPFCTTAGCVPLTVFQNGGAPAPGRVVIGGPNGLALSTFTANLTNGTPADLVLGQTTGALSILNQTSTASPTLNNINNQACIGSRNTTGGVYTCNPNATPYVNFIPNRGSGVLDLFLNDGRYRYDSLQTEIRKRFSDGLYFQANYTYSKNLTNAIGTSQALFEPYLDNANQDWDYQRADFDTTHAFNINAIYQLPFGQGKKFLNYGGVANMLIGGWEISGLSQWTSGAPITFVDTRGTLNRTGRSGRQTPVSSLSNQQIQDLVGHFEASTTNATTGVVTDRIYWFDPSILNANGQASAGYSLSGTTFANQVFFNVNPGQTGNIGRALIDGPSYFNVNMALLKNIRLTETMRIQLRAEVFNLLNNVNFRPNTQFANINSTTFGQITSAFGPREIQIAARFEW